MAIEKTSDQVKEKIRKKSATSAPTRPGEHGYTAAQAKAIFTAPLLDEEDSLIAELNRVIDGVNEHIESSSNPHGVTKEQIGLGNVDNTPDVDKPISNATREAINEAESRVNASLMEHAKNNRNPHDVTKAQVGLGNVDNTSDLEKPISRAANERFSRIENNLELHEENHGNPHGVTKEQIGLGKVDNTSDENKPLSAAARSRFQSVESRITREAIASLIGEATENMSGLMRSTDKSRLNTLYSLLGEEDSTSVVDTIREVLAIFDEYPKGAKLLSILAGKVDITRKINGHMLTEDFLITKSDVGLGNVDNTSDENKPLSAAARAALAKKIDDSEKGATGGVASLDGQGKVPLSQLPEIAAKKAKCVRVKLKALSSTYTVAVQGVNADERAQLIIAKPPYSYEAQYNAYNIRIVGVGENAVTFQTGTPFSETIPVDIVIIDLDPDEIVGPTIIEVTDEYGNAVTDENGNPITIEEEE